MHRRNFLKTTSLGSLALIPVVEFLLESFNTPNNDKNCVLGSLKIEPRRLVDAHIHLFNARYLPLEAIIKPIFLVGLIAGPLANYLYALTDDFGSDEANFVTNKNLLKNMESHEIIDWFLYRTRQKLELIARDKKSSDLSQAFQESLLFNSILELEKIKDKESTANKSKFNSDNFRKAFLENYMKSHAINADNNQKKEFEKTYQNTIIWALEKLCQPKINKELQQYLDCDDIPVINFLATMLDDEVKIYQKATSGYGKANLVLQVHYMMDMCASYEKGYTFYPFNPVQTNNMMKLVSQSDGKLLGFTAFNPLNENAMTSFQEGIAAGNIGVKFYPPMGYKPINNLDPVVEERVNNFFSYCQSEKIPIFTHCTPQGFQAKKGYGLNCDPKNWRNVLRKYPNLRICFGHAGGGDPKIRNHNFHGWYSNPRQWLSEDCYARIVVELCQEYEFAYCEVGHLRKIISNKHHERDRFFQNLIDNFNNGKFPLKNKICFGTDWDMIGMINEQNKYYELLVDMFQDSHLRGNIEGFFSQNFINFLSINNFLEKTASDYLSSAGRQYLMSLIE